MEKEFEIQMDYTVEDFYAYWKGFVQSKAGKPAWSQSRAEALRGGISCFLLGAALIAGSFWLEWTLDVRIGSKWFLFLGGILILAGIVVIVRNRKEAAYPYWVTSAYKKYQQLEERDIFCFSDKGFEAYGPGVDHHYDFSAIKTVWADEEHFYVDMGKNTFYMLPHHNFTLGSPAEFPAFWIAHTGRPVLPVSPTGRLDAVIENQMK